MDHERPRAKRPRLQPKAAAQLISSLIEVEVSDEPAGVPRGVPGFQVRGILGEGGGGVVYDAIRDGGRERVALKVLHRHLSSDGSASQRARRELGLLRELRGECVPHLVDHGEIDGRLWMATEFVDGVRIDEFVRQRDAALRDRVILLAGLADAVQTLHGKGLIHRDLKPSNVLVRADGTPVVIDLGIAMLDVDDGVTLTETGTPIGSPRYMAPEQARGERDAITVRTDVYGLGAIGYCLLTGEPPHDGDASLHELIRRAAQDEPRDPRSLRRDLPNPLVAVLRKATAPDPALRYATAEAFGADLRRWLNGEAVEAGGVTMWRRMVRFGSRHPRVVPWVAAMLVGAGVPLGVAATNVWRSSQPFFLEIADSGDSSRFLSSAGVELRYIYSGEGENLFGARAFDATGAPAFGLGFKHDSEVFPDELHVYRGRDVFTPAWSISRRGTTGGAEPIAMPDGFSAAADGAWSPMLVEAFDVFAENPGEELVTVHFYHPWCLSCVRIWDLDGSVLDEFWHQGQVRSVEHFAGTTRLALAGHWNALDLAKLGQIAFSGSQNPHAVTVVEAEIGRRALFRIDGNHDARPSFISDTIVFGDIELYPWLRRIRVEESTRTGEEVAKTLRVVLSSKLPTGTVEANFVLHPDGTIEAEAGYGHKLPINADGELRAVTRLDPATGAPLETIGPAAE